MKRKGDLVMNENIYIDERIQALNCIIKEIILRNTKKRVINPYISMEDMNNISDVYYINNANKFCLSLKLQEIIEVARNTGLNRQELSAMIEQCIENYLNGSLEHEYSRYLKK